MKDKLAIDGGKPVRDSFLVYGAPRIEQPEIDEVVDSLKSGWLGTGPKCKLFEDNFKRYVKADYAIALSSCTAGLHLALICYGIGAGDEVITTPMTFCATSNVIEHVGAKPVFVDVDRETMNIDAAQIERAITPRTKAILPVHFAGRACDMVEIERIAKKHSLVVIEDAAHSIETVDRGRKIGSIAPATSFSFYATKNICTGEGGMITTNDPEIADKLRILSLHGISKDAWKRYSESGFKHYTTMFPGYKYNMMDIQASLGIHQLKHVDEYHVLREKYWRMYNDAFSKLPIVTPADEKRPDSIHAMHMYTIFVDEKQCGISRDRMLECLRAENIGTGVHYVALHEHKFYKEKYGYKAEDFPNAHYISDRTLTLPLSAKLTEADAQDVIAAVTKIIGD